MDNIKDENLKRLGRFIAQEMFELAKETRGEDWEEQNIRDNTIGELARCVTLQNLYLDREEYEKCIILRLRIQELTDMLNIDDSFLEDLDDYEK
tara:strand:+ start:371 stop:652 length:282 start_codon:yes stop_codon:yes gene_type:complete